MTHSNCTKVLAAATAIFIGCQATAEMPAAAPARIIAQKDGESVTSMAIPTARMSAKLFRRICMENRSNFSSVPKKLHRKGFKFHPEYQSYAHPSHDVSFALVQTATGINCSMVFAAAGDPPDTATIFLNKTVTNGVPIYVGFLPKTTHRNYIHAQVAAK